VVRVAHRDHGGRGEAATALEDFVRAIESEQIQLEHQVRTLGEVLTTYIEHCRRIGRRQATVESYEMVAKRITMEMKETPINILTGHDFDEFYGGLGKILGANTIRQTHAVLHAAFDQAVKWGWVAANPMASATPPGRFKPKREALAMGDVYRMIQRASSPKELGGEGDLVTAMAVILATITGARRGELAGLRWEDIDEDSCSLRIERQWVPGEGGQYLGPPKSSDGPRTVVLGEVGMALITRYRHLIGELLNREPKGWLLSHDAGTTPLRAKALGAAISRLGTSLGIEVSTHSFRRASATELVASGVDVDTSARRLGHTTEVMLQSYVLGSDDRAIAAAGTLETRLAARGLPLAELLPVPQ
jgi:integrase